MPRDHQKVKLELINLQYNWLFTGVVGAAFGKESVCLWAACSQ